MMRACFLLSCWHFITRSVMCRHDYIDVDICVLACVLIRYKF